MDQENKKRSAINIRKNMMPTKEKDAKSTNEMLNGTKYRGLIACVMRLVVGCRKFNTYEFNLY
jgi:hypothetical protein